MRSLIEIPEDVDGSVLESCFMSLAKVIQCGWVLNREINLSEQMWIEGGTNLSICHR